MKTIFLVVLLFAFIDLAFSDPQCGCSRPKCPECIEQAGCPRVGCNCYRADGVLVGPPAFWPQNLPRPSYCRTCSKVVCRNIAVRCVSPPLDCGAGAEDYIPVPAENQ